MIYRDEARTGTVARSASPSWTDFPFLFSLSLSYIMPFLSLWALFIWYTSQEMMFTFLTVVIAPIMMCTLLCLYRFYFHDRCITYALLERGRRRIRGGRRSGPSHLDVALSRAGEWAADRFKMEELQSACVAGLKASYSETGVHYEQSALRETSR